ncbi:Uncharacterised protein [Mycobacteroides abscessus subsp. abscessus]|nr:Uncharacterised protein [Mycobacteroides abscessus subsp. abscessus]SKU78604.1 Uncharacterised protein [Mycobacteroides abscessus subsp. abscessus]
MCSSAKRPTPLIRSIRLRCSWARTTSISLRMTCSVRASRSSGVMLAFTR